MSFTTGYNFTPNTFARAGEINDNFKGMRGHFLPITQSGAWETTNAVYDLGSAAKKWKAGYFSGTISCSHLTTTSMVATTITATHIDTTLIKVTQETNTPSTKTLYQDSIIKGLASINNAGTSTQSLAYDFGVSSISNPVAGGVQITWDNSFGAGDNLIVVAMVKKSAGIYVSGYSITSSQIWIDVRGKDGLATNATINIILAGRQS